MEKLIQYIKERYKPEDGARTSEWSEGNGDDQFYDGVERGYAVALKEVADIIGMECEPLAIQE
jgi:hypothetical protein